ncbi:hypothetical protein DB346_24225 [Verrucomicrobia bacterium LW23]|nr:hypothetical protein DB346_24225 [Verrucomicrobia bacterium LW23]
MFLGSLALDALVLAPILFKLSPFARYPGHRDSTEYWRMTGLVTIVFWGAGVGFAGPRERSPRALKWFLLLMFIPGAMLLFAGIVLVPTFQPMLVAANVFVLAVNAVFVLFLFATYGKDEDSEWIPRYIPPGEFDEVLRQSPRTSSKSFDGTSLP